MINLLPFYMVRCLLCTLIFEIAAAAAVGVRRGSDFANVALVNVLTNPVIVVASFLVNYFTFGNTKYIVCVVLLELAAFLTEALIYRKALIFKRIGPFIFSLILNGTSYLLGLIINKIF